MPAEAVVMERLCRNIEEMDRAFDVEFWQRQGPNAIFAAAWEMVEFTWQTKGWDVSELEFQRSVENFQRVRS